MEKLFYFNFSIVQDLIDEENQSFEEEEEEAVTPPSSCPLLLSDGFEGVVVKK